MTNVAETITPPDVIEYISKLKCKLCGNYLILSSLDSKSLKFSNGECLSFGQCPIDQVSHYEVDVEWDMKDIQNTICMSNQRFYIEYNDKIYNLTETLLLNYTVTITENNSKCEFDIPYDKFNDLPASEEAWANRIEMIRLLK